MATRRLARQLALQTLFGIEVGHRDVAEMLEETTERHNDSETRGFVRDLVYGTIEHAGESELRFAPLLQGWTVDRLPTIDRLLLRMSLFEMLHHPETPRAVVINEAVELAKKFSTEDSGRFVNGVLAGVLRTMEVAP